MAPFEALEVAGISVVLVSARQVKQLKGRKTDVADSVWLARVCQFGLASPSHVPPKAFRETRALTRYRCALVGQRSRVRNRVQKVLDNGQVGAVLNTTTDKWLEVEAPHPVSSKDEAHARRLQGGLVTELEKAVVALANGCPPLPG